jgi:hypothetical protein
VVGLVGGMANLVRTALSAVRPGGAGRDGEDGGR